MRKGTILDTTPRVLSRKPNRVRHEILDLTGDTYGELVVKSFAGTDKHGGAYWTCDCSCGKSFTTSAQGIRVGAVISCGHVNREKTSEKARARLTSHGASNEPWYSNYSSMVQRTTNKNLDAYHEYRKRHPEIVLWIEPEWVDNPWAFYNEIGDKPGDEYSIDRIDNHKGYVKGNIRWATPLTQNHNRDLSARGTTGFIGVQLIKAGTNRRAVDVYNASISYNNKSYSLGTYDSLEDAKIARWREEERLGLKHTFDIDLDREPVRYVPKKAKGYVEVLVGDTFGELTVIEKLDGSKLKLKCECGNVVVRDKNHLISRNVTNCADINKHKINSKNYGGEIGPTQRSNDYVGKRYGSLVLNKYEYTKKSNVYWSARCDCGNVIDVALASLVSGHTKTCGHSKYKYIISDNNGHSMVFKSYKEVTDYFGISTFRTGEVSTPFKVTSKKSKLYGYTILKKPTLDN